MVRRPDSQHQLLVSIDARNVAFMPFIQRRSMRHDVSATFTHLAHFLSSYGHRRASQIGAAAIIRPAEATRTAEAAR